MLLGSPPSVARPAERIRGCICWRCRVDRIALAQRSFNGFPVRSEHNSLPLHDTGAVTVLSHYIRIFVQDFD
jgi:hypothetical protein